MKKHSVVLSPVALGQIAGLRHHIMAKAGNGIAKRYIFRLRKYLRSFKLFPNRGTLREDLRSGMRLVPFEKTVTIAFSVYENKVTILGVYYGGQDIASHFKSTTDKTYPDME